MENNLNVKLSNIENNVLVSDILRDLSLILKDKGDEIKIEKAQVEGAKGEILTAILVGITVNALTDLVKFLIKKYSNREDFNSSTKIKINNTIINIGEIN
jgi:hypothetical protein